ncbi:MAG TPA: hypothetical protein PLM53_07305 [Spirochaetota bacterium]|nr:hypothetical protein [Spirochaetota bacterium]HPC42698.1 hypothetical protein [Spirochaetota bacterium]HPL15775.1 hypothetical protein [Spirochaetota bacterium]HQF07833.1 hypothetical protein [Spirochaetota bacterium]HQH96886.1 hypothetical protein [Spirochaetota bacterium]
MDLKKKLIIIIGLCLILSVGSIVIITKVFDKTEEQLLQKCRIEALVGSKVMNTFMELMVHTNQLTADQITDTNYVPIPGTDPQKYTTKYDAVFDKYIQKFEDEFLNDEDVVFSILIDKNGYVPTHNSKYSRPEGKDHNLNLFYSRSKRNFATNLEIKQVLQYRGPGTVKYLYERDTGESMWDIGAPVQFRDSHWGAFLVGISLHRIDIIKNQMVIITVTIMIIILSFTLLVILAVIPQKYLVPQAKTEGGDDTDITPDAG